VNEDPRFRIDAPAPTRRRFGFVAHPLFHLGLFLSTFVTTTIAGAVFFGGGLPLSKTWMTGLRFSLPALVIMGTHEMGHYLMCRRYGVAATLPYFLPAPTMFGTFGAVIRIQSRIRDKAALLDIGAAGPLAGFLATLPFLFYSVGHATPIHDVPTSGTILFSYPLLVRFAQDWSGVARYTSATVHESPMFMAAWLGMLVTALNLLPIGQLDGGHVLRAALGKRQPMASIAVLGLALLALLGGGYQWAIFAAIMAGLMGIGHPPVDNDDAPLGTGRLTIALVCVAVFMLCATLVPIATVDEGPGIKPSAGSPAQTSPGPR
jgi:membrane-associated protease RseP (regulator of RpoE activity)